jgi:hypothetical protein
VALLATEGLRFLKAACSELLHRDEVLLMCEVKGHTRLSGFVSLLPSDRVCTSEEVALNSANVGEYMQDYQHIINLVHRT